MGHTLVVLPIFLEIPTAALMLLTATLTGYLAARAALELGYRS